MLWPDEQTSNVVGQLWDELAEQGLPSLATLTHRLHRPHLSLVVAEELPHEAALEAVGPVPERPVTLRIESAGVFPGGVLFLACVPNQELLVEQRRVYDAVEPLVSGQWPHYRPGRWTPHITCGTLYSADQLSRALPVVLKYLPMEGGLDRGGVEDGTTGENWRSPVRPRSAAVARDHHTVGRDPLAARPPAG